MERPGRCHDHSHRCRPGPALKTGNSAIWQSGDLGSQRWCFRIAQLPSCRTAQVPGCPIVKSPDCPIAILPLACSESLAYKNGERIRGNHAEALHDLLSGGAGTSGRMDPYPHAVPGASPHGAGQAREEPGTRAGPATLPKLRCPPAVRAMSPVGRQLESLACRSASPIGEKLEDFGRLEEEVHEVSIRGAGSLAGAPRIGLR
jgi:hypothetical protein